MAKNRKRIKQRKRKKIFKVTQLNTAKPISKSFLTRSILFLKKPYRVISIVVFFISAYFLKDPIRKEFFSKKNKYREDSGQQKNYGKLEPAVVPQKTIFLDHGYIKEEFPNGILEMKKPEGIDFKAWIENDKIVVTADVRDPFGNLIARLNKNDWMINEWLHFDRNFDDSALEVLNNKGQIVFQVQLSGNLVKLEGVFFNGHGDGVMIAKLTRDNIDYGYETVLIKKGTYSPDEIDEHNHIQSLFYYPSVAYPGKRRK